MVVLTIHWQNWDRTILGFLTEEEAHARLVEMACDEYPEDDGNLYTFVNRGNHWWIDRVGLHDWTDRS